MNTNENYWNICCHTALEIFQIFYMTLNLLKSVLMQNVIAGSEESLQFRYFLLHLAELVCPLHFIHWAAQCLHFIDLSLQLAVQVVGIHPLPDGIVHLLQLLHLLLNLVKVVSPLDGIHWTFQLFQIKYFVLQFLKFILMVHIENWIRQTLGSFKILS